MPSIGSVLASLFDIFHRPLPLCFPSPQPVFFLTSQYMSDASTDRADGPGRSSVLWLLFSVGILTVGCTEQEIHSLSLFVLPLFDSCPLAWSIASCIPIHRVRSRPRADTEWPSARGASCLSERMCLQTEIVCHWPASSQGAIKRSSWLDTDSDLDGPWLRPVSLSIVSGESYRVWHSPRFQAVMKRMVKTRLLFWC